MTTLIHDLIAMSHDIALFAAVGKIQQNTADLWVKTVEEAVNSLEWRAIETAPKDGEVILLYKVDERYSGPFTITGFWSTDDVWWPCAGAYEVKPTHWKPLPAPPEAISAAIQKESEVTK
jgi:hypothetical protein